MADHGLDSPAVVKALWNEALAVRLIPDDGDSQVDQS